MNITPDQMLKKTSEYLMNLAEAKRKAVFVGLPAGKTGSKVYKSGSRVIEVGAGHEYGLTGTIQRRSFLRVPFAIKKKDLAATIASQFRYVFEGRKAGKALGLIGAKAQNISQGAFTTKGYGVWPDIKQATKDKKGSSQVLIDQGTLRSSITWVIR